MYTQNGICYAGELVKDIEVASFKKLEDAMILVTFSTGETRLFDISCLFKMGSAFSPLTSVAVQDTIKLTHGFLSWQNGEIDIAPETLYKISLPYTPKDTIAV